MIVYVAPADKRKNSSYHTEECGWHPENPQEMRKEVAKSRGYTECGHCSGLEQSNPDLSYQEALKEAATDE